jgi:hypothetical protein
VLSVNSPGTSDQSVLSILLALFYIKLYSHFKPYETNEDDVLAETGQYQICATFFFAMVIQNELLSSTLDGVLGVALIVTNLCVLYVGSYYEVGDLIEEFNELKDKNDSQVGKIMRSISSVSQKYQKWLQSENKISAGSA